MNVLNRNKSLITLLGITTAAMLGGFAGCSSSSGDDSSNGGDGGTGDGSTDDGSNGGDGSPGTDGGGGDSGPAQESTGYVTFTQSSIAAVNSDSALAAFYVLPAGTDLDCAGYGTIATPTAATTSCAIKICTNPVSTDGGVVVTDAGPTTSPNTGNITLLSTVDTTGAVIVANADGTYTPTMATAQWWAAGDTAIEVKSVGSSTSIPAFDDTALVGPGDPTAPTIGGTNVALTGSPAFDRGTDLNVTYSSGIANTKVYLSLTTTSTAQKSIVSCNFDAGNGAQVVKSADLGMLQQAGQTGITGAYTLQARNSKATTAGAFNFNVVLNANAHSGTFTNTN